MMRNYIQAMLRGVVFMTACYFTSPKKLNGACDWPPITANATMPDVFTKSKRSQVMSRIRGRGNKETEVALAKLLRQQGLKGWRRHQPIFGKPDFIFREARLAVFVDGCFWHCCPKHATQPESNQVFWKNKLSSNRKRDRCVNRSRACRRWMRWW